MAEIVQLDSFKARKLAKLRREHDDALLDAELLHAQGKYDHAKPHLERAKEIMKKIRKLSPAPPQSLVLPSKPSINWGPKVIPNVEFTFSQDLGNTQGRDPDDVA